MQLADGIWRVDGVRAANVYLVAIDAGVVVVDTGTRGSGRPILAALQSVGYGPQDVRLIAITHAHVDHIGGLPELQQATGAPVAAAAGEAAAIRGTTPLPHPPGLHGLLFRAATTPLRPAPTPVQQILTPNMPVPGMSGWHAIGTPGHTPEHLSFYHPGREFLIAGDALANLGGLRRSPWIFTSNMALARASVALLAGLPVRSIAAGHGPPIVDDPGLARRLDRLGWAERSR